MICKLNYTYKTRAFCYPISLLQIPYISIFSDDVTPYFAGRQFKVELCHLVQDSSSQGGPHYMLVMNMIPVVIVTGGPSYTSDK